MTKHITCPNCGEEKVYFNESLISIKCDACGYEVSLKDLTITFKKITETIGKILYELDSYLRKRGNEKNETKAKL